MVTVLSVWTNYTIGIEHIDGTGAIPQRGCDRDSGMDETAFNRCVCVCVCVCLCVFVCVCARCVCVVGVASVSFTSVMLLLPGVVEHVHV